MNRLEEAKKKLAFADYLLNRSEYNAGALKHILHAANLAVMEFLGLENATISPMLVQKQLENGTESEKEFSRYFLEIWKMTTRMNNSQSDIKLAYKKVKEFIEVVREYKLNPPKKVEKFDINKLI